jgi:hypothetical protein
MYLKIVTGISVVIIASGSALAEYPPLAVSPDSLADVPAASTDEFFYNYSWRSFIALNWPAQIGAASRGVPDRKRHFGDTNGPRVWMTWKSRYEIFQPMGRLPSPWASYEGQNPCGGEGFDDDVVTTLSSFSAFHDFDQAGSGNPLVAQNHTYVRYEVRVNEPEFDSIVGNKWYIAKNLPTKAPSVPYNIGSTSIKAAWRIIKKDEPYRDRYYVTSAHVFDVTSGKCILQDVALVGFHIVTKTKENPHWIWSTFEHIDNVPANDVATSCRGRSSGIIKHEPTVPFSFYNPAKPPTLDPLTPPPRISPDHKPKADPQPMQVVRDPGRPITQLAMDMNNAYWNLPEIKGTVWQNYMLVMTQWESGGEFFPSACYAVSNTTMETYLQNLYIQNRPASGCMQCHKTSNEGGRDFVMFVTLDAFQPGALTPGDPFSAKGAKSSDGSVKPETALSSDPMLKSLKQFFEAIEPK